MLTIDVKIRRVRNGTRTHIIRVTVQYFNQLSHTHPKQFDLIFLTLK